MDIFIHLSINVTNESTSEVSSSILEFGNGLFNVLALLMDVVFFEKGKGWQIFFQVIFIFFIFIFLVDCLILGEIEFINIRIKSCVIHCLLILYSHVWILFCFHDEFNI